jgi:hydroxymethylglutaryl-CoA reductase
MAVMPMKTSDLSGFYKLSPQERLHAVAEFADLSEEERRSLGQWGVLDLARTPLIENTIGTHALPLGIATNFLVNGKDYLVPMVLEEPSVVAAASNAAKMARAKGGFRTSSSGPVMIGQIQLTGLPHPQAARHRILEHRAEILDLANSVDPVLVKFGGGARDLEVRVVESAKGPMVIAHLLVDCRDAMGANAVNTMAEACAPLVERLTGGRVYLRIISNLAVKRLARASAIFAAGAIETDSIPGPDVVEGILQAYAFAQADPFRCATHNKGIMNGVDAVVIATGNDFRAIEAGAHSYAAWREGGYRSLTHWERNPDGDLVGSIELPMAVGLVGGATAVHPTAKACVKLLGVKTATELGEVIAAVGLAQNFAAIRALATEGIQRGHMSLHARNMAVTAGAAGDEIERVVEVLVRERKVRADRAKEVLEQLRSGKLG